jgi:filamentous hemagglutinin
LTAEQKGTIDAIAGLAGSAVGAIAGNGAADVVSGGQAASTAVGNNYLTDKESRQFDKELSECKASRDDCTAVYEKYLAISNQNSKTLRERCADGGVRCVQDAELIQAYTYTAGKDLSDPDAIKVTQALNGLDILFLRDNVSTTDQVLFSVVDNFPFSLVGIGLAGRNLAVNTKQALTGAALLAGTDIALQYGLTGEIRLADLVSAGVIGAAFANPAAKMTPPLLQNESVANNTALFERLKLDLKTTEAANRAVESLRTTGRLPEEYVTQSTARQYGWDKGKALGNYVPGGQLGGDVYKNAANVFPSAPGRIWYEADIGLVNTVSRAKQGGTRLVYSNDGLLYITTDHYKTATAIGRWK